MSGKKERNCETCQFNCLSHTTNPDMIKRICINDGYKYWREPSDSLQKKEYPITLQLRHEGTLIHKWELNNLDPHGDIEELDKTQRDIGAFLRGESNSLSNPSENQGEGKDCYNCGYYGRGHHPICNNEETDFDDCIRQVYTFWEKEPRIPTDRKCRECEKALPKDWWTDVCKSCIDNQLTKCDDISAFPCGKYQCECGYHDFIRPKSTKGQDGEE